MSRRPESGEASAVCAEDDSGSVMQVIVEWLRGLGRNQNHENAGATAEVQKLAEALDEQIRLPENLSPVERLMLLNVLKLGDVRVGNVMVPRADIVAVEASVPLDELLKVFHDGFHTRIPVYRETLDDVAGFVHIKDVIQYWDRREAFQLGEVLRKILFVPPSMRVLDLFLQMREQTLHMAMVVDEYGGTDGLVTIEDLVEEIVGEIEGEHERVPGSPFTERADGSLIADGRALVEELEERLGRELVSEEREEDIESVGGLLFSLLGRVPFRGEIIPHPAGIEFEVLDSDGRRVKRVRVASVRAAPADAREAPSPGA
jgi:magnesium and cobalt transporter